MGKSTPTKRQQYWTSFDTHESDQPNDTRANFANDSPSSSNVESFRDKFINHGRLFGKSQSAKNQGTNDGATKTERTAKTNGIGAHSKTTATATTKQRVKFGSFARYFANSKFDKFNANSAKQLASSSKCEWNTCQSTTSSASATFGCQRKWTTKFAHKFDSIWNSRRTKCSNKLATKLRGTFETSNCAHKQTMKRRKNDQKNLQKTTLI